MSDSEQEQAGAGQGGGTGGLTGTELDATGEEVARPDLDPDAWDANLADDEPHHDPHGGHGAPVDDQRGAPGEDEGQTLGETPGQR